MGFYYGPSEPPKPDREPGGCLEALIITRAVFAVLAIPLAAILGVFVALAILIALFGVAWYWGVLWLAVLAAGVVAYARWERHRFRSGPPV